MSHHRTPDPIEAGQVAPAHAQVRRASVKRSDDEVEIVMPLAVGYRLTWLT